MIATASQRNWHTPLLLGLFLLLLVAVLVWGDSPVEQPFDPDSRSPSGLLMLREWLQEMGYQVTTSGRTRFAPSPRQHMLLIYPGEEQFTPGEAERLLNWVEEGGTAVIVGHADRELRRAFNYRSRVQPAVDVEQSQPLLPEATESFDRGGRGFDPTRDPNIITVLKSGDGARLAVLRHGDGWVWLAGESSAFTNGRLSESRAQAQLFPAFLRTVPAGGTVVIDTYHLFGPLLPDELPPVKTFRDWVYLTPTGWAALFLLLLGGGWLLLSGRRLGPPLEVPTQGRRREAAEFVVAMAGLQRRARVRDHIARHQRYRLKQTLGRPWRLRPSLPDDEFLRQLQSLDPTLSRSAHHGALIQGNSGVRARPDLTIEQVAAILDELATVPDEERLLQLARRVDDIRAASGDSISP